MPNTKFVALDTYILRGLQAGFETEAEACNLLSNFGFYFIVTETTRQELGDLCRDPNSRIAEEAKKASIQMTNWLVLEPHLKPVDSGIAEIVADKLIAGPIAGGVLNDGLVIAEAALHGCSLVLTARRVLLNAKASLGLALLQHHLPGLEVASPEAVIREFSRNC